MNLYAVFGAALATFVVGFLFHGPLFGKLWMRLAGIQMPDPMPSFSSMIPQMVQNYIANVVIAFAMAAGFQYLASSPYIGALNWWWGLLVSTAAFVGLVAPITTYNVIWMNESKKLWLFEFASQLTSFAVLGAVLGATW